MSCAQPSPLLRPRSCADGLTALGGGGGLVRFVARFTPLVGSPPEPVGLGRLIAEEAAKSTSEMRKQSTVAVLLLSALFVGACSSSKAEQPNQGPRRQPPETIAIESHRHPVTLFHTGTVVAERDSTVSSTRGGRVVSYGFDVGQRVRRGDVLVTLESAELAYASRAATASANQVSARLAQLRDPSELPDVVAARVELRSAEDAARRAEKLLAQGSVSEQEAERSRTNLEAARARYDAVLAAGRAEFERLREANAIAGQAQAALGESVIRAPFDGIVVERFVAIGEVAAPNGALVRVLDPSEFRVRFAVSQFDAEPITIGRKVLVRFDQTTLAAHVVRSTPGFIGDGRARIVDAQFDETPPATLLPGALVSGWIETGKDEELVEIDRASTIRTAGVVRAWIVEKNQLVERLLSVARVDGDRVFVRRGLRAGERLVKTPQADFRSNEELVQ